MNHREPETWHKEVIPAATESTIGVLLGAGILTDFYLAGGTGLALRFGHRLSRDLDFFSKDHFDEEVLLQRVQRMPDFSLAARAPSIGETKVSFLGYEYPVVFPAGNYLGVSVAEARDIACMKVSALASRGTKRDFVDLYVCARRFGLSELLNIFRQKYEHVRYSRTHLLKSLVYFADAEKDPMPQMLISLTWEEVKQFFVREVPRIL